MGYHFINKKSLKNQIQEKKLEELEQKRQEETAQKIKDDYYKKPELSVDSVPTLEQQPTSEEQLKIIQEKERIKKSISTPAKNLLNASNNIDKSIIDLKKVLIDIDSEKKHTKNIDEIIYKLKVLNKKMKQISEVLIKFKDEI